MSKGIATGGTGENKSVRGAWRRLQRPLAAVALGGAVLLSLQGCAGIMLGGAMVGTMAATARRALGAQTEDKGIVVKGESCASIVVGEVGHVYGKSFYRLVLVSGEVKDEAMICAVEREFAGFEYVQS